MNGHHLGKKKPSVMKNRVNGLTTNHKQLRAAKSARGKECS